MPGSQTDAFKGISVFLGLIVTFGSSGLVNQIMSGFMITYSRALRIGDFVRIGDVEGTVTISACCRPRCGRCGTKRSRFPTPLSSRRRRPTFRGSSDTEGVFTPTSVTIGYDAPWRQVHALLLLAATHGGSPARADTGRASGGARGFLREVHAPGLPGTPAVAARSRCTHCTRTSRISSTSTACRSCRRTTCSIRRRRRWCRRKTGSPRPRLRVVRQPRARTHAHARR